MGNRDPGVDTWFETYDDPQKELVQAVRRIILDADPRVTETIKWKSPTFMHKGDLASFYPKSTKHVCEPATNAMAHAQTPFSVTLAQTDGVCFSPSETAPARFRSEPCHRSWTPAAVD